MLHEVLGKVQEKLTDSNQKTNIGIAFGKGWCLQEEYINSLKISRCRENNIMKCNPLINLKNGINLDIL